ncbi:putative Lupus LA protein sjogren Syndrome type B antigen LA/SS-B [Daphnia magna]|uniref:Putative Lupus LA protein sjogren Syndrome type B antigen LA/SS-B n=1 Tax=Daphnia magna TaxID=35525 RepID=A0A162R2U7_9CRUS|nr:putative Lupus LA protein sjogren Syndrome type B antigen LA/SS-B [Daphnia magna]
MAPNPNECVVVLQMQQSSPTAQELSGQIIKIVTSDVDSTSDEGEHFYDASSDIGGTGGNGGNDVSDDSAPENNSGNKADSGIEDVTFEIPDAELAAQIVEQAVWNRDKKTSPGRSRRCCNVIKNSNTHFLTVPLGSDNMFLISHILCVTVHSGE